MVVLERSLAEDLNVSWEKGTLRKDHHRNVRYRKTRFVFKIKFSADGSVQGYKSRLVAKGFTQYLRVDFSETFIPVVGFHTMWIVSVVSASKV